MNTLQDDHCHQALTMPTFTLRFTVDQINGKPITVVDYVEVVVDCYNFLVGLMDEYESF